MGMSKVKTACSTFTVCLLSKKKKCEITQKTSHKNFSSRRCQNHRQLYARVFVVASTAKDAKQRKNTTYAQSQQTKQIRAIMVDIVTKAIQGGDITNLIKNLTIDSISSDIVKHTRKIYPLENVHVSKVKVVKRPKLDLGRLAELHGHSGVKTNAKGEKVERGDAYEPQVLDSV